MLREARLSYDKIRGLGTPRRLTLLIDGLAERQEDLKEEVKGPSKKAAFDGDGNPTKALEGFLRSKGLTVDDITVREQGNGEYVFATKRKKGRKPWRFFESPRGFGRSSEISQTHALGRL